MEETNKVRERWLVVVSVLSCYIPNLILSKDDGIRQAWREKFTLCKIIGDISGTTILFLN